MGLLTALSCWLLVVAQSARTQVCKTSYFHIQKGFRIDGEPRGKLPVDSALSCAMLCDNEEFCRCSNLLEEVERFVCELFDKCENQKIIEDEKATLYSTVNVEIPGPEVTASSSVKPIDETPALGSRTLVSTPDTIQMTSSAISPSTLSLMTPLTTSVVQNSFPAVACKKIYLDNPNSPDGAYDVTAGSSNKVFCDMTGSQTGCSGGGWTLVMKIDGQSTTFRYDESKWTTTVAYSPYFSKDLGTTESKAETYATTPFTQICLGMQYNNIKRWTIINMTSSSLYALISGGVHHDTNLQVSEWKNLVPVDASQVAIQANCRKQGINAEQGGTGVRIGIIATKTCGVDSDYNSRIGFGAKGNSGGQDGTNSCGHDARNVQPSTSHKTFGFILVK